MKRESQEKKNEINIEAFTESNKQYNIRLTQKNNLLLFETEFTEGVLIKKFKIKLNYENLQSNKIFSICSNINDVFVTIQDYLKINKTQSIKNIIHEQENAITLIIPLQLSLIREFTIELKEEKINMDQTMYYLINGLEQSKKKINELEEEINEQNNKLILKDKEIDELKKQVNQLTVMVAKQNNTISNNEKIENTSETSEPVQKVQRNNAIGKIEPVKKVVEKRSK